MRLVGTLAFVVMAAAMFVILAVGASKPANAANTRIFIPLAPRATAFGLETAVATSVLSPVNTRTSRPTGTATLVSISKLLPANPPARVTVTSSNNSVRLSLPPGFVQVAGQSVAVQFAVQPAAAPPSGSSGTAGIGLKSVDITIETLDGQQVTQLSESMTIEFTYTEDELEVLGVDASQLQISYSSDSGVTWQTLTTTVDTADLRAYAEVSHLTRFGLSGGARRSVTATPTVTTSSLQTSTVAPSNTLTPSATNTSVQTSTMTLVPTNSATTTQSPTNTPTATYTATTAPTSTPTRTLTVAATSTPTLTPTQTFTRTATTIPTSTPTVTSTGVALISAWRINTTSTGAYFTSAKTDVQSITVTAVAGTPEVKVNTSGIPSYSQTMSSSVRATLVARPNAATDFVTPRVPNIGVGTPVAFGQNIGFKSTTCVTPTTGGGYWPKGPACASVQSRSVYFPLTPVVATSNTSTSGGAIGYWVNGVSVYNWSDAQTYNSLGVWYRTAADWEGYDMDIDYGHSTMLGDYHHHFHPSTLAAQLGDTGTAHSPIYGFAADGFPIYGPWYASGVLAQSGWQKRDYDTPSATTGCGTARKRTCLMVDQTNKNGGTTTASSSGPDTNVSINTSNGNAVLAVSGVYAQDYYHDATACTVSAACLDRYNGHTHDGLGYHYHVTVTQNGDGSLSPAFPYVLGLKYYGKLPGNSFAH